MRLERSQLPLVEAMPANAEPRHTGSNDDAHRRTPTLWPQCGLKHRLGNRTHAANILGISIRTLRNKLNEYATDGVPIPPPDSGDMRVAR